MDPGKISLGALFPRKKSNKHVFNIEYHISTTGVCRKEPHMICNPFYFNKKCFKWCIAYMNNRDRKKWTTTSQNKEENKAEFILRFVCDWNLDLLTFGCSITTFVIHTLQTTYMQGIPFSAYAFTLKLKSF